METLTDICRIIRQNIERIENGLVLENMAITVIFFEEELCGDFRLLFAVNHFQVEHVYLVDEREADGRYSLEVVSNKIPSKSNNPNSTVHNGVSVWLKQVVNCL